MAEAEQFDEGPRSYLEGAVKTRGATMHRDGVGAFMVAASRAQHDSGTRPPLLPSADARRVKAAAAYGAGLVTAWCLSQWSSPVQSIAWLVLPGAQDASTQRRSDKPWCSAEVAF